MANNRVTIMGSYVADVAFRIDRLPTWGETRMGQSFQLGPGGKGSNQAVAAARAGAPGSLNVSFISKLGPDPFGRCRLRGRGGVVRRGRGHVHRGHRGRRQTTVGPGRDARDTDRRRATGRWLVVVALRGQQTAGR